MKKYTYNVVIVGSGCAGYNCADTLYDLGVRNIAIVTEGRMTGTSRNTGSDKQTYYKLSLAGDSGDSVLGMAQTLFDGGAMDGDIALAEAANSTRCFMKLAGLGVPFPTNEYGEYVGYKTDHDPYCRATSIGPYTSKKMTEALEASVISKKIDIIDRCQVVKVLKSNGKVAGLLAVDLSVTDKIEYIAFDAPYVVLATGGPAAIYYDSVYPECHTGSSDLALDAGADMSNLSEWQYGLASVDFRWNVSGTYQQVIPRYISVDENGVEREFLTEYFTDNREMLKNIFLKGYEWPFDVRKIYGSSYIDLLVYNETVINGRKVYLDFTREPSGLENGFDGLNETAYTYLKNSDALLPLPVERLKKMNSRAISLYKDHGIDITKEPLRIAVCAQHNNGGISVDKNWQTTVSGLYAVGECAGTFGIFRPGGSALNSTQVGSLRAAEHIRYFADGRHADDFDSAADSAIAELDSLIAVTQADTSTVSDIRTKYQHEMSRSFAFIRDVSLMKEAHGKTKRHLSDFASDNKWNNPVEIPHLLKNLGIIKTQLTVQSAMLYNAANSGSRGSAYVIDGGSFFDRNPVPENESSRSKVTVTEYNDGNPMTHSRPVRPIPERDLWFEKVWNEYNRIHEDK